MDRESILWHNFEKSGTVADYLAYKGKISKENKTDSTAIKKDTGTMTCVSASYPERNNEL